MAWSLLLVLDYVVIVARFWGVATTIVTWGVAIETLVDGYTLVFVLLANGTFLLLFEVYQPLHKKARAVLFLRESWWSRCWDFLELVDNGCVKAVVYATLGALSFLQPRRVWLAAISGVCSLILSTLYLMKWWRDWLLSGKSSTASYSRFSRPRSPDLEEPKVVQETLQTQSQVMEL